VAPVAVSVVAVPEQIGDVAVNPVGAVEVVVTFTVIVTPPVVVLHGVPSLRRTQYVVVVVGLTVMETPVCVVMMLFPTVAPVPQTYEPPVAKTPPVAVSVVLAPAQIAVVPEIPVGAVEAVFTVTVKYKAADVAEQLASIVLTQ
jgi:hypothetical protein